MDSNLIWIYTTMMRGMLLLLLVEATVIVAVDSKKCRVVAGRKFYEAHCSSLSLDEVPRHLERRIKLLDLSDNVIYALNSDSFTSYPDLEDLNLRKNNIESAADDVFSQQTKLQILDLQYNNALTKLPDLPCSLITLRLSGLRRLFNDSNIVKLPNMHALKNLIIQSVRLKQFPKLNDVQSSLVTLDIRRNSDLTKFHVGDLAALCNLKNLYVGNEEDTVFEMKGDECACREVQEWIRKYEIQGTNITCKSANSRCDKINLTEFESIRTRCKWASKLNQCSYTYWIIGAVVCLILLCISCFCCIRCCRNRKKKVSSSADYRTDSEF